MGLTNLAKIKPSLGRQNCLAISSELAMPGFRIPGPLCGSSSDSLDKGTLMRWRAPPPNQSTASSSARQWHLESRQAGFAASTLAMSPDAVKLLKAIETLRFTPYDDQTGKQISTWVAGATIGYGHLIAKGDWPNYKAGITETQADALFLADAAPFEKTVGDAISIALQQYQFDALVILAFNIGASGFTNSSVVKLVNDPQAKTGFASLESAWKAWNKSQGKLSNGLVNRRAAEWKIYTSASYERW